MGNVEVDSLMPEIEQSEAPPALPEAQITTDPPADKHELRNEKGQFASDKPKEEPKPEGKAEAKPEPKPEAKSIPLAAYMEDKRSWQQKLEAMEKELQALKTPPKAPEPIADEQVKPTLQSALEKLKALESKTQEVEKTAKETSEQTGQQRFLQELGVAEQVFLKDNPDYYEALEHTRRIAFLQLREFHPEATEEQIFNAVRQQEIGMAMQLARAGRNPIATAYNLAKAYGYKRKESAPELPKVEEPKKLAPDLTLGSGGGLESDEAEVKDPFAEAFGELFGKRKAS